MSIVKQPIKLVQSPTTISEQVILNKENIDVLFHNDNDLQTQINNIIAGGSGVTTEDLDNVQTELQANIDAETARAQAKESNLEANKVGKSQYNSDISTINSNIDLKANSTDLNTEINTRTTNDSNLQAQITQNASNITFEINRATTSEANLQTQIDLLAGSSSIVLVELYNGNITNNSVSVDIDISSHKTIIVKSTSHKVSGVGISDLASMTQILKYDNVLQKIQGSAIINYFAFDTSTSFFISNLTLDNLQIINSNNSDVNFDVIVYGIV